MKQHGTGHFPGHHPAPPVRGSAQIWMGLGGDIASNDVIVGNESMAMVLAIQCGRRVVCRIPPGGRECALPFLEIEKLREFGQCG